MTSKTPIAINIGMAAPIWITPKGTLGTIQEQTFYELRMEAYDPGNPDSLEETLRYKIVAGSLPPGLVMYENGSIQGQPKNLYYLRGVPFDVKQDTTSTFCCRAQNVNTGAVTDRTFSITVTGEDPPDITTNNGEIGRYLDGSWVEIQLEAVDLDNEPIVWRLSGGALPPGLTLNTTTGLISGYIDPTEVVTIGGHVGWESDATWDEYPWDNSSRSVSATYQFSVQAYDGKTYDGASYSIFVYSHNSLLTDNELITSDLNDIITTDTDPLHNPVLLTIAADLGTYAHDNYFAYQFKAKDFDGDDVSFSLLVGEGLGFDNEDSGFDSQLMDFGDFALPPGLTLNTETGWLYGQIPRQGKGQTEYQFAVRVYKTNYPTYISGLTYFTMTIVNDLRKAVTWHSPSDLGSIDSGGISEKFISATNELSYNLLLTLDSGRLPQGIKLNPDGLLVGRASFELTSFDAGTATFDANVRELGFITKITTLDRDFTFTVKASDSNEEIVAYKTFTLSVSPEKYGPYESLYLRAQSGKEDKEVISTIFRNTDVIPSTVLYRNSDPNFGRSRDLRLLLLAGITASSPEEYMRAMATNHYRKNIRLGKYSWAQALNSDGSVAYDVVYVQAVDDLSQGGDKTVPAIIDLSTKIKRVTKVDNTNLEISSSLNSIDGKSDLVVYPNSLLNMRENLRETLTLSVKEPLPRWMTSKQEDGRILGWTPSVVVAYVKAGEGRKVVFNLNRINSVDIKSVSFDTDRYIWDTNLSKNYNTTTNTYEGSYETTFDETKHLLQQPVATVDFAVDVPFSYIDGRTSEFIDSEFHGLDGIIASYVGKRIIFATQESYAGFTGEYDGWVRYGSLWDDVVGWDDGVAFWDEYEVIPSNQRSAVWEVTLGDSGELRLVLVEVIQVGQIVEVLNGFKYGGFTLRYGPLTLYGQNETVPSYHKYEENSLDVGTTFDNKDTRFISSITVYQDPDEGDKYLAFPRTNIWA